MSAQIVSCTNIQTHTHTHALSGPRLKLLGTRAQGYAKRFFFFLFAVVLQKRCACGLCAHVAATPAPASFRWNASRHSAARKDDKEKKKGLLFSFSPHTPYSDAVICFGSLTMTTSGSGSDGPLWPFGSPGSMILTFTPMQPARM